MNSSRQRRVGHIRRLLILCFLLGATVIVLPGTLTSVTPSGASPGVLVNLTGTGFSQTPAQNQVTFTPPGGGAPQTTVATTSTVVDAAKGVRRLAVRVPAGLPAGVVAVTVLNTATGEASNAATFDLVTIALPERTTGILGAQNVAVRITGSANAKFVTGTRPAFGAGITVVGTTIESPTSLVSTINIASTAAAGPRTVSITLNTQSLLLTDGFQVVTAPPPNTPPMANANGPYSGNVTEAVAFSSAGSTDADGDPLTYAWAFGDGATSSDPNPVHAYAAPGNYVVTLTVSDGKGGATTATTSANIVQPNRSPQFTSSPPLTATEGLAYAYQLTATDPDGDPLTFSLVTGPPNVTVTAAGLTSWTPGSGDVGSRDVQVRVSDGRGGVDTQAYSIAVSAAVQLTGIELSPSSVRFTEVGAVSQLLLTGTRSDQSATDLTAASTGTTYESSNTGVATVSADGSVRAIANGSAVITARNGGFSDTSTVAVEIGVILETLDLTPPVITLRAVGATAPTTLRGSFSDQSVRDLTNAPGTTFTVDIATIASVDGAGQVTAVGPGTATLTARHDGHTTTAQVQVILATTSTAFLRGEVFDDRKGVPLSGATATVLPAGVTTNGVLQPVPVDARGSFVIPSGTGATGVRIERSGFTSVDRLAEPVANGVTTVLDSRLTALDGRLNLLQSVFGGQAASADGSTTLNIPPGSLDGDAALRVTPVSNQGLYGLLPIGWSPIAAVDIQPADRQLAQAATLRVPHVDTLPAGAPVVVARYDATNHRWVAQPGGQVSADRRTLTTAITQTGQFVFLVPDEAPFVPPPAVAGEPLSGLAVPIVPGTSTVTGEVIPRSAPPGDDVRAVGTVILQPGVPLPSGAVLRARVEEQFDLLDASRVRPLPFVQDLVLYARPRLGGPGTLGTRLPITPTLQFTIQQLSLGQVKLDLTLDEPIAQNAIVGAGGGSLTDDGGDALQLPAGALAVDVAIGLRSLGAAQFSTPVPDGFTSLGGVLIDLVGTTFGQPVLLSITRPSGLDLAKQIVVAQAITDIGGGRRFKVVGLGEVNGTRIGVRTTLGGLTFEGVRGGGEYVFLQPPQPLGFVGGIVDSTAATPQALAQVSSTTAPFVFVTGATGTFVVAGRAGVASTIGALDSSGASGGASASLAAANDIAAVTVTLAVTAPTVVAVSPAANSTNVALDASVIVDFSKPIDPATVTAASVVLRAGSSAVTTQVVVSANRRRLTLSPRSPLAGLTAYTVALTSDIRDQSGTPLLPFAATTFTTLDPSKPAALALGVITAELPGEDGVSLITGAPGAADAAAVVVATNTRTQESAIVIALADGSFRVRIGVVIGDEIALTFRDANRRETTISITQFSSTDGTTAIGQAGGTVAGADGRIGRILSRALSTAGLFQLSSPGQAALPLLPNGLSIADRFGLTVEGAAFRRLESLTLTESQGRFGAGTAFTEPFTASGQLTVPPDFLVSAAVRFTATAIDRDGTRRTANGTTVVVASNPDTSVTETGFSDAFPSVFLTAPNQAFPTQVLNVSAIAPASRVEFDLPSPAPAPAGVLVLGRAASIAGEPKLATVDRLAIVDVGGTSRLRTTGREFPGASNTGEYVVVSGAIAFVVGHVRGPAVVVAIDGWPFIAETEVANGAFVLAVPASDPFTLRFSDRVTGAPLGTASGQGPAAGGLLDVGTPLTAGAATLTTAAQPDAQSVVDIGTPLVFTFSEPLDPASVTASAFVITDDAGARAFGSTVLSDDRRTVTFVPFRRWRFATHYRYGVATTVAGASGARLAQPFGGEFTTFAPRILGSAAVGVARDVAASGNLGVTATENGFTVLDLTRPSAPVPGVAVPLAAGARAVALVDAPLIDRVGQATPAPLAVVASGDVTTKGLLQTFSLATPAAPVMLGSTQLTIAPREAPPAGVPPISGTPSDVGITAQNKAMVAVRQGGVTAVDLGTAIPTDASRPGLGAGPRFPTSGVADAVQTAALGERVVVATTSGLVVLDGSTLQPLASVPSAGSLTTVAAAANVHFDTNGDGTINPTTESFDIALVGDAAGVLQVYKVAESSAELLSVIRLPAGASIGGIAINPEEGLAYVGAGGRGLALIDLSGPGSVQPIDGNFEGIDDRVLGLLAVPGTAGAIAPVLNRGFVAVAAGAAGLHTVQIAPARTRFTGVRRDPLPGHVGDEESLADGGTAFTTDRALLLDIDAIVPDSDQITLTIEEAAAGARTITLPSGLGAAPLASGSNAITASIAAGGTGGTVAFVARNGTGSIVARRTIALVPPPAQPQFVALMTVPSTAVLDDVTQTVALAVGGRLIDGRILNVTRADQGTEYQVQDVAVASVNPDGLIAALAGGGTVVEVRNQTLTAFVPVGVQQAPVLTAIDAERTHTTLFTIEPTSLAFVAAFSDGTSRPAGEVTGIVFSSSNTDVAVVNALGVVTAVADGVATVRATSGLLNAQIEVAVELRGAATISAIDLSPFTTTVTTDDASAVAVATVTGTGAVYGRPVTFSTAAGFSAQALTDAAGRASAIVSGLRVPGSVSVTASVVDPSSGQTRSDQESLVVVAGSSDAEPNNATGTATALAPERTVTGTLTAGSDAQDFFRVDSTVAGSLQVSLTLGPNTTAAGLVLVVRDANGNELSRVTPTGASTTLNVQIPAGGAFVSVELAGQAAAYNLRAAITQAPITITSVTPPAGPGGTAVVIAGTGFSSRLEENDVFFADVRGRVVAATPTRLDVVVPVNAINGTLSIISGAQSVDGPPFVVGNAGPLPTPFSLPDNPAKQRFDPLSGSIVDVSRLWVEFDVTVTRARVDQLLAPLGATVAGFTPTLNQYLVERAANITLADLRALKASLRALPEVTFVVAVSDAQVQTDRTIDMRDRTAAWANHSPASAPFELGHVFDAIETVRRSKEFRDASNFKKVKVAVIDTGYAPTIAANFPWPVTIRRKNSAGVLVNGVEGDIGQGHGTAVAGLIAAANDGDSVSGVLASLYRVNELPTALTKIELVMYACGKPDGKIDNGCILLALQDIRAAGDVDVVNMSLRSKDYEAALAPPGCPGAGTTYSGADKLCWYYALLRPLLRRSTFVVVAAGNDGIIATNTFPAAISRYLPNVLSVGAVASVDKDGTGERYDQRSRFFNAVRADVVAGEVDCRTGAAVVEANAVDASNCGSGVTLAAPGEDYLTTAATQSSSSGFTVSAAYRYFNGTSSASPFVAGIVAMLQSIRPNATRLTPVDLQKYLVTSADDISSTWLPAADKMTRVNALRAVKAVLKQVFDQRVFVADQADGAAFGNLVALEVNPSTGEVPGTAKVITLQPTVNGTLISGLRPTSIVTAPGDLAYVLAATDVAGGDAVFVINTVSLDIDDVILLGRKTSLKSTMVATRNGRLLFVSAGTHIVVVDTIKRQVITDLDQLVWSARVKRPIPSAPIAEPFSAPVQALDGEITSLALSTDDRSLYATVRTGGGTGEQGGLLLEIDVELDRDSNQGTPEIELDLTHFFTLKHATSTFRGRDEPSAVAASPDSEHVYMTNGGVESFTSVTPSNNGLLTQLKAFAADMVSTPQIDATVDDLAKRDGYTMLLASGRTQTFSVVNGRLDAEVFSFPSELSTAWTPDKPVISDQLVRRQINSERPFGIAFRPMGPLSHADGNRALVSFFQTGNFGVLDLGGQVPQPIIAPADVFNGFVAVTRSLTLDNALWPKDPAQESQLFAGPIAYAQHGRFAVGIHTGVHSGAVTIIDDKLIDADLIAHREGFLPNPNGSGVVPFFSIRPLCATRAAPDDIDCLTNVSNTLTQYNAPAGLKDFARPRGVGIHPFVSIVGIGTGERVHRSRAIVYTWRDSGAAQAEVSIYDLGTLGGTLGTLDGVLAHAFSADEISAEITSDAFSDIFSSGHAPIDGHRYRVEVRLIAGDGKDIGFDTIEVVFRQ